MTAKAARLPEFRRRLAKIDRSGWSPAQQNDYRFIEAELNALDFFLRVLKPWSRDVNRGLAEASDPDEMVKLGFQWEASRRFSLGGQWRYVDRLPTISNGVIGHVPRYFELDMHADYRLSDAWRVSPNNSLNGLWM